VQRREFITLLGGAVAVSPLAASAQQARVYTLGVLTLPNPEPLLKALREGLRDAGYVEGGNLRLEIRSAAGRPDLQLDKAAELVRLKVNLIVTFFTPSALAAKQATRDIPIVMAGAGDPTLTSTRLGPPLGALASYGSDYLALARQSAVYIDKILKGAKPADLPVAFPTKFLLVINLKTAKELGIAVPPTLLDRADEVIE
jgi:ABC-type uncharacterized transport system substrate-binding protein